MLFVGLLTGIKAVSHTATTVRVDVALTTAFGLPGCADQSVLADPLDAAREADVADLATAIAELFGQYSQTRQHAFEQELLVLDVDLSPLPASKHARSVGTRLPGTISLQDGTQTGPGAGGWQWGNRVGDGDLGAQRRELAGAARSLTFGRGPARTSWR